jgi:hypothetical protein
VNLRGRKASLPRAGHARPEYVSSDGLVVHHYNRDGRVKDYDFSTLPVAEPVQRSLAALFADRCVPHIWGVHTTSENNWMHLEQFAAFLSQQDHRPGDLDGLTVALVKRWRQASNHRKFTMVAGLLLRDARLQTGLVADELSRKPPAFSPRLPQRGAPFPPCPRAPRPRRRLPAPFRPLPCSLRVSSPPAQHSSHWKSPAPAHTED